MPNDNKQQPVTAPPIIFTEDALPPMPQENSGSAAPADDIVMPVITTSTTPKKKFAGGKVIATILGLFLLVGGIGAGVYLVGQNQNISEKAGSCEAHPCGPGFRCDGDGGCIPRDTPEGEEGNVESIDPPDNPWGGDGGDPADGDNCDVRCQGTDTRGQSYDFCIDRTSTKGCDDSAIEKGYTIQIASGNCSGGGCGTETWLCKTPPPNDVSCDGKNGGVLRPDLNANSCYCGVLQVDTPTGFKSYKNNCGCSGGGEETPPEETVTTTTATDITAQCQNIKAYSTNNWTLLTPAVLSTLKAGDSVNFCVAGSATGGSFDRAKFTINGVVQAETTLVRPGSTDFCQSYTVPAGVNSFNVTAQIHHLTLGWK